MATMVDAYGPSACCECCNREVNEGDLQTMSNGAEFCPRCAAVARRIEDAMDDAKEGPER